MLPGLHVGHGVARVEARRAPPGAEDGLSLLCRDYIFKCTITLDQ